MKVPAVPTTFGLVTNPREIAKFVVVVVYELPPNGFVNSYFPSIPELVAVHVRDALSAPDVPDFVHVLASVIVLGNLTTIFGVTEPEFVSGLTISIY